MKENARKGKRKTGWIVLLVVIAILFLAVLTAMGIFHISEVEVSGNQHYTEEEIKELVMSDSYSNNSLYLYWKYNYTQTEPIPFVDTLEVTMVSPGKVRIKVYEKSVVGYIEYLGTNMYFDKDGVVVESSNEVLPDVPLITGLKFEHIVLYKKLPVEDPEVFRTIVELTQMLDKQQIRPDRVEFTPDLEILLYFGSAKVMLGKDENLFEKIDRLKGVLPQMEGLSGTLHMENMDENTQNFTFDRE